MSNQSVRIIEDEPALFDLMHRYLFEEKVSGLLPMRKRKLGYESYLIRESGPANSGWRSAHQHPRHQIALSQIHLFRDLVHIRDRQQRSTASTTSLAPRTSRL